MLLKNKVFQNASWIVGVQIMKSLFSLTIGLLTARYLGPSNFGVINYAMGVISFVTPFLDLGLSGILVNELVKNPDKEGETLGTAIALSFLSSILCTVAANLFVFFANAGERETIIVCALYSAILIFQSLEIIIYWFQAKLLSKYSSIVSLISYIIVSAYRIYLLVTGKSVRWFAVSYAMDYAIIAAALFFVYRKKGTQKLSFSLENGKKMFSVSKYYIVSAMMITIFANTDKIMLKLMLGNTETGYYSAAVKLATITCFVFEAVINSMRPVILSSKDTEPEKYEKSVIILYSLMIYMSLAQSVGITLFSRLIINVAYGKEYFGAILPLRIVVWYTTFSYLGAARNVWILAENLQKYMLLMNICGAVANVILNALLIPIMGASGAAIASLITQIFTNFIIGYFLKPIVPTNRLMVKAINPKYLINLVAGK